MCTCALDCLDFIVYLYNHMYRYSLLLCGDKQCTALVFVNLCLSLMEVCSYNRLCTCFWFVYGLWLSSASTVEIFIISSPLSFPSLPLLLFLSLAPSLFLPFPSLPLSPHFLAETAGKRTHGPNWITSAFSQTFQPAVSSNQAQKWRYVCVNVTMCY